MFRLAVVSTLLLILGFTSAEETDSMGLTKSGKPCRIIEKWGKGISNDTEMWKTLSKFTARQEEQDGKPLTEEVLYDCFFEVDTEEYKQVSHEISDITKDQVTSVFSFIVRDLITLDECAHIKYTLTSYKLGDGKNFSHGSKSCELPGLLFIVVFIPHLLILTIVFVVYLVDKHITDKKAIQVEKEGIADKITLKNIVDV